MDHQPANGRRLVKVNLTRSQMDTPGLNTTNYPTGIIQFSPCGLMDGSNGKIQCFEPFAMDDLHHHRDI